MTSQPKTYACRAVWKWQVWRSLAIFTERWWWPEIEGFLELGKTNARTEGYNRVMPDGSTCTEKDLSAPVTRFMQSVHCAFGESSLVASTLTLRHYLSTTIDHTGPLVRITELVAAQWFPQLATTAHN